MKITAVVLFALLTLRCSEETRSVAPRKAGLVEELASPAGVGAAEPFLSAARDGVLLSWLEPVAGSDRVALRFARYRGGRWDAARTIVERSDLVANWADFPSIVEDAHGALFAHWLQKSGADTYAYDVRMAVSTDGGATWGAPFLLNRDGVLGEHGFVTLAALPKGGVAATWLDSRNMKAGQDDEEMTGDMMLRYATVDAGGAIGREAELDGRTCECCTTGMAITSTGPVVVYRDRSPEEVRDISYVKLAYGIWTKPQLLHADGWKIAGCPVNGPQIDALGDGAAVAWFAAAEDQGKAFVAFSPDGGMDFDPPVRIDDGKPIGRLDVVMLDGETALVTWLEQTAAGGEIRSRRVRRSGGAEPSMKIADSSTARAAGFARMARSGGAVYFTWTEQGTASKRIHVARMGGL